MEEKYTEKEQEFVRGTFFYQRRIFVLRFWRLKLSIWEALPAIVSLPFRKKIEGLCRAIIKLEKLEQNPCHYFYNLSKYE